MTDEELAAIDARAKAATPGPWLNHDLKVGGVMQPGVRILTLAPGFNPDELLRMTERPGDDADAEFIARAREDIPALLAEVRGLRAENEALMILAGVGRSHTLTREELAERFPPKRP